MDCTQQMNAFDLWLETNYLPGTSQLMWYKLFAMFNRCGWAEWIFADSLRLMALTGIKSKTTFIRSRDELVRAGLLAYQKGKKGVPGKYKMTVLYAAGNGTNTVPNTVPDLVPDTVPDTVPDLVPTRRGNDDKSRDVDSGSPVNDAVNDAVNDTNNSTDNSAVNDTNNSTDNGTDNGTITNTNNKTSSSSNYNINKNYINNNINTTTTNNNTATYDRVFSVSPKGKAPTSGEQSVVKYYLNNIQPLASRTEVDKLCTWLEVFPPEVVIRAVDEAIMENKRKLSYIEGILRNWQKDGLFTLSLVEGGKKEWQDKKNSTKPAKKKSRFANFEGHDWDYEKLDKLAHEYLAKSTGESPECPG